MFEHTTHHTLALDVKLGSLVSRSFVRSFASNSSRRTVVAAVLSGLERLDDDSRTASAAFARTVGGGFVRVRSFVDHLTRVRHQKLSFVDTTIDDNYERESI